MPHPKPGPGQTNLSIERVEKALLWKIDQMKSKRNLNRSRMMQELLWAGLEAKYGIVRWDVRVEYAEQTAEQTGE